MWRAAGLEEPNAKGAKGAEGSADADAEMEADNFAAGGFFGWTGREQLGAGRVMARAFPTPTAAEARGPLRRLTERESVTMWPAGPPNAVKKTPDQSMARRF